MKFTPQRILVRAERLENVYPLIKDTPAEVQIPGSSSSPLADAKWTPETVGSPQGEMQLLPFGSEAGEESEAIWVEV